MKSKTRIIWIIFFLTIGHFGYGQSKEDRAYEKALEAIEFTRNGEFSKSIELLNEAKKLDPKNIIYSYELALVYTYKQDYLHSNKQLKKLLKHKDIYDQIYQLIGVNYSYLEQPDKAIEYFDKGLEKFPNSGILHLERGNMDLFAGKYDTALYFYEKGIKVAPSFPSNYYWASRIYCNSTEEVWGLIYGEIFMNLERNSQRTAEISNLLFDTYLSEIKFTSDTSMTVSFCQQMFMNFNALSDTQNPKLPFCMVYEPTLLLSIISENEININSLDRIRTRFIENYYEMGHHKTHPNVLFDYKKKILETGHLESYNHWILMKGDEDGFDEWYYDNEDKWSAFIEWFTDNPIVIGEKNNFHKDQY